MSRTFRFKTADLKALKDASARAGYGRRVRFEVGERNGTHNLLGIDCDEHDLEDKFWLVAFHRYRLDTNADGDAEYDLYTYEIAEPGDLQGNLWLTVRGGKLAEIRDLHRSGHVLWTAP